MWSGLHHCIFEYRSPDQDAKPIYSNKITYIIDISVDFSLYAIVYKINENMQTFANIASIIWSLVPFVGFRQNNWELIITVIKVAAR